MHERPLKQRRSLTSLERVSIGVIAVALVALVAAKVASRPETGPVYSVAQVIAAVDAAGVAHHTNPAAADADEPNRCALVEPADRGHVRELYRTQVPMGAAAVDDADLVITGFDTGSHASKKANANRDAAARDGWLTILHGNLYIELQAPVANLDPALVKALSDAVNGVAVVATPTPPVLHC